MKTVLPLVTAFGLILMAPAASATAGVASLSSGVNAPPATGLDFQSQQGNSNKKPKKPKNSNGAVNVPEPEGALLLFPALAFLAYRERRKRLARQGQRTKR